MYPIRKIKDYVYGIWVYKASDLVYEKVITE